MRRTRRHTVLVLLVAAACGSDDPPGHTVETLPSGVVRVVNHGDGAWTDGTRWRPVEELRLGREDGEGPELFGSIVALETDGEGNLFVLDQHASEVRVFDPRGRHLRTFGRSGAGPGEFRQPAGLTLDQDGDLWVYDPTNARFSVFAPDGTFRTSHRRASGMTVVPWPGRIDRSGRLWDVGGGVAQLGGTPLLLWSRPGTDERGSVEPPHYVGEAYVNERNGGRTSVNVPFAPALAWALDADGRLWSGVSDAYRIHLHEPGGDTLRIVERVAEQVPVTAAERDSVLAGMSWFVRQGGTLDPGRVPSRKAYFSQIRVDDRGYLWVTPSLPYGAPEAAFDVFDPEGIYQGRIRFPIAPDALRGLVVRGDRAYGITEAEEGHPQVVVFRLEGRPAT